MVWIGRDLKDNLVPSPCRGQVHLPLFQLAQYSVQRGLEHFQGWDMLLSGFYKYASTNCLTPIKHKLAILLNNNVIILPTILISAGVQVLLFSFLCQMLFDHSPAESNHCLTGE